MSQSIFNWLQSVGIDQNTAKFISIFLISLLPILELRGGLIAAAVMKLHWLPSLIICFIGNILPIPFILLFIKKIFNWLKKFKPMQKMVAYFENKAHKKAAEADKKSDWGKLIFVYCFVAIPLPGTGAWTGALIASFMDLKIKRSFPAICLGVLTAGAIMLTLCYFLPDVFGRIFGFTF